MSRSAATSGTGSGSGPFDTGAQGGKRRWAAPPPPQKRGLCPRYSWKTGGRLDRLHIRAHLWWVSRWIRRLLVVTGARRPLTKPVVAAVELQAITEPHCSRGVQPGGICVGVVRREPTPGGPGSGLCPGRRRFL
jgi:hypothetical protein